MAGGGRSARDAPARGWGVTRRAAIKRAGREPRARRKKRDVPARSRARVVSRARTRARALEPKAGRGPGASREWARAARPAPARTEEAIVCEAHTAPGVFASRASPSGLAPIAAST